MEPGNLSSMVIGALKVRFYRRFSSPVILILYVCYWFLCSLFGWFCKSTLLKPGIYCFIYTLGTKSDYLTNSIDIESVYLQTQHIGSGNGRGGALGAEPPQYFEWRLEPQKPISLYIFWLKKGLKSCIFRLPNTKFLRQGVMPPCNPPKPYAYKGLKLCHGSSNSHSLIKRREAPLQPPKIIHFCKFRLKKARNGAYLARKYKTGCWPPCIPPNRINL